MERRSPLARQPHLNSPRIQCDGSSIPVALREVLRQVKEYGNSRTVAASTRVIAESRRRSTAVLVKIRHLLLGARARVIDNRCARSADFTAMTSARDHSYAGLSTSNELAQPRR